MDEITDQPEELNVVIYNPSKDNIAYRSELLFRTIKIKFDIELPSEDLNRLTLYDVHQLDKFIKDLKETIYRIKRELSEKRKKR